VVVGSFDPTTADTRENHVRVPLEASYMAAWEDIPPQYQSVPLV